MVAAKRSKFRPLNAACKPACDVMVAAAVFYKKSVLMAPGGAAAGNI